MAEKVCERHKVPMRRRKDGKGHFCRVCVFSQLFDRDKSANSMGKSKNVRAGHWGRIRWSKSGGYMGKVRPSGRGTGKRSKKKRRH